MCNPVLCRVQGTRSLSCLLVAIAAGLTTNSLYAWDAYVTIDDLESSFYVDTFSGNHTWTTLSKGINADTGGGNSLPNNPITQNWNGSAWPTDSMSDQESGTSVSAESYIEHYDGADDEFFDYAEVFVYGDIPADTSYGGSWFYNFELVLDPFATANVFLDSFSTYGYIASEIGDVGNAFAGIKLFSTDVGLNDPGGSNVPYDSELLSLAAPPEGESVESEFGLSHTFTNSTASPVTYNLRLSASVSIFESATSEELAGDYNDDGTVDAADYTVWRDAVGAPAGTLLNDIDGGVIGSAQYDTWVSNYGISEASSTEIASTVPEPGTALLALFATVHGWVGCRRRV